jgi:hypothetical protein
MYPADDSTRPFPEAKMSHNTLSLDQIEVASPCEASWDEMKGTDRVRFCDQCQLHVYNLSEMNRKEAVDLVRSSEGQACVRFYRRVDGTLLTKDCPIAFEAAARLSRRAGMMVLAAFVMTFGGIISSLTGSSANGDLDNANDTRVRDLEPFKTIMSWFDKPPSPSRSPPPQTMGKPAFQGKMKE